jgi:ribonuclease Z
MSAIGKSSVVFVTLSGLFWGGWVLGSQTPEGQEAIARAYAAYAEDQAVENQDLFDSSALRAIVCGGADRGGAAQPCLAVVAAGRLFVVDAGSGAADSLVQRGVPLGRLQAVLLTSSGIERMADLSEMYSGTSAGEDMLLPVYGPADTQRMVDGLNQAAGFDGASKGLQAWGPSPEPGRSVIVFEADGLVVSAFTSQEDAFSGRVGYRFDYRGRSVVISGDTKKLAAVAKASSGADVLIHDALSQPLRRVLADAARDAGNARVAKLLNDIGDYHASPLEAAEIANEAGVRLLVYTHFVPALIQRPLQLAYFNEVEAVRGRDSFVVGYDGLRIDLPAGSGAIVQSRMRLRV